MALITFKQALGQGGMIMRIGTKCSAAVHCLLFLHEYGETQKVTSTMLALSTGCNSVVIRNLMSALKKAGIVESTVGKGGTRLCQSPEEITLYRIYEAVDPGCLEDLVGLHPCPSALCPIGRNIRTVLAAPYGKLREDVKRSLESYTLADVVSEYHRIQKPE